MYRPHSTDSIKNLIDQSKDYLETRVELTKLKAIDKSADVVSGMIVGVSMVVLGFLVLVFLSIAAALLIGEALGEYYYGFFIMGGFYALLLLLIFVQRNRWIKIPVANGIIHKMNN